MQKIEGRDTRDGRPIAVMIENGRVVSILQASEDELPWISAGFIDLQVNGYGGDDLNAEGLQPETVVSLAKKMAATGVTTFLPTIITASEEKILAALRTIATARNTSPLVAYMVPYVHLEGPYISALDGPRGAHLAEHVRPPSLSEFERWQAASGGLVGMITLSPHFAEAEGFISSMTARGVHVAVGHTDATSEQIRKAVDAGARLSTHLGNGIGAMLPRHPNILWTQLAEDRLTATLIADGHHLPADTMKSMLRAKGVDRTILVSDAVAIAGMPPGRYNTAVGGKVELHANGRLSLAGTEFLAGAALPLKDGVACAGLMMGVSLANAVRMATENPGRFVGHRGVLEVGARADLVRFTVENGGRSLLIDSVFLAGETVVPDGPAARGAVTS